MSISYAIPIAAAAFAAILTWLAIAAWLRFGPHSVLLDSPHKANAMHSRPTPSIGGIAMCAAGTATVAIMTASSGASLGPTIVGVGLIALMLSLASVWDDARPLPVLPRLLLHFAAALAVVMLLMPLAARSIEIPSVAFRWLSHPVGVAAIVLGIVWCTNLFNFMDGSNGLVGGTAAIGFAALACLSSLSGAATGIALMAAVIAGALVGFLPHNLPMARTFMGDAGAIPLGFLAGTLGLAGNLRGCWPWWYPLLVFAPLVVDATYTLASRVLRGQRVWQSHREHCYHRLILEGGWSHAKIATLYASLGLIGATVGAYALLSSKNDTPTLAIAIPSVITYVSLLALLERQLRTRRAERLRSRHLDSEKNGSHKPG